MTEWQPIETAPKDGTEILAFGMGVEGEPVVMWDDSKPRIPMWRVIHWKETWYDDYAEQPDGSYRKDRKQGFAYWGPNPQQFRPTHWMPLPTPPTKPGK